MAVAESGRIRSVVLVGPMGLVPAGSAVRQQLARTVVETSREGIERKLRVLVHDPALVTESWIEEEWRINNSAGAAESFRHLAGYFADRIDDDVVGADLRLAAPEVRSLLVWGSHDVLVPTALARDALAVLAAGTELVTVESTGHAPYLERPDAFNAAVIPFLTGE
jgi:pimeloyl-ACP methyl ester carboxylesterase